jgi:aspartyl-tRNA(Asn)/glutamyl-tRNA(Gln) amidotransferase subunit C
MAVTRDDVRHVAGLARLGISDDALETYVAQLNGILAHMEVLAKVPTVGAEAAAEQGMPLRDDVVAPVQLTRPLADFAPKVRDGFILVPRLATHEDAAEDAG